MSFKDRLISRLQDVPKGKSPRIALITTSPDIGWKNNNIFSHLKPIVDSFVHSWEPIVSEATDFIVEPKFDLVEWARNLANQRHRADNQRDDFGYDALEVSYGMMRANHLKVKHEIKMGFIYDIVVFAKEPQNKSLIFVPERNLIYGELSFNAPEMAFSIGIDYFYGDSETMDKATQFARWIPSICKNDIREPNPSISSAFHYHLAQLKIGARQS